MKSRVKIKKGQIEDYISDSTQGAITNLEETTQINIDNLGDTINDRIDNVKQDANYVHDQSTPSSTWTINHPLNKKVSVTVTDTAGTEVGGETTINDGSTVVIKFNAPFSGYAVLN